ncbi:GTP-binding protein Rho1, partial [Cladochytrium tenue]
MHIPAHSVVVVDLGFDPRIELMMWDTTSNEEFERLRPLSYTDADVFIACFSVDDPSSLDS